VCFKEICLPKCEASVEHEENAGASTSLVNQTFLKAATSSNEKEFLMGLSTEKICEQFQL